MITTLSGANGFRIEQEKRLLIDKFVGEFGDLALEQINCDEVDYQLIHDNLVNLPFLTPKKLVVLHSPSANKQFSEEFSTIIDQIPENVEVLIIEEEIDKRSTFFKQLKKITNFIDCTELSPGELVSWVRERVKALNGEISTQDVSYLIEVSGVNQLKLKNEIDKLIAYSPQISKETIEALVVPSPQTTIFQLIDVAFRGNPKELLRIYEDQKLQKVQPQQIIALLAWQVHVMALIKSAGSKSVSEIASKSKLNPFVVSKNMNIVRNLSMKDIHELTGRLLDLDVKLKTQAVDADDALLELLISIAKQ